MNAQKSQQSIILAEIFQFGASWLMTSAAIRRVMSLAWLKRRRYSSVVWRLKRMMLMFRLRCLLFTVFLPFFSHQCPELPFFALFWRIFLSHHFHSLKFYCVNAGLQPTVWNNPGLARLPENKTLLLNDCKRLN